MFKQIACISLVLFCHAALAKEQLVDPTRPIAYVESKKNTVKQLNLQAIFFGNGREEAIVNGTLVKAGDKVQGKKIVRIKKDSIVYEASGQRRILELRPSIFKK